MTGTGRDISQPKWSIRTVRAFLAIVKQTIRSSVRSKVFHVLFGLILLSLFLLPVTVSGDGTAMGQLQIALTYSLGVVVALISTATLWLSCALLSREIESYSLHMVAVKPCPRWLVWTGKWFGVFVMHAGILILSAILILALVMWRVKNGDFSEAEMETVRNELLVGRRAFAPEWPEFRKLAAEEYKKRRANGTLDTNQPPGYAEAEILRRIKANHTEVAPGEARFWTYKGVSVIREKDILFLRYRMYAGSTSQGSQRRMRGTWAVRDPSSKDKDRFIPAPREEMSGVFHELKMSPAIIDKSRDGLVVIGYRNPPANEQIQWEDVDEEERGKGVPVVFQLSDGPHLLVRVTGFTSNFIRSLILALFQIAFLSALGCTVGAAFSTPVAAFVAVAYLVIGMSVQAAVDAPLRDDLGRAEYKGAWDRTAHVVAQVVRAVVVSVDDLDATSDLARGRLIEYSRIGKTLLGMIVLRGGLIAAVGMWILTRRELGVVIRR